MSNPLLLVVGAGPGVGGSVARAFGRAGYDVALIGRAGPALTELGESLQADGVTTGWASAEVADPEALRAAVTRFAQHSGRIDVLHFNPSAYRPQDPLELSVPALLEDVAVGVGGLLTALQAAYPHMSSGGRVTVTGSAAADRPSAAAASLGIQKAALRNLVRSIDDRLAPEGIRAVTVTVNGVLAPNDPRSPFHPDAVGAAVLAAAEQEEEFWACEVLHPTP